MDADTTQRNRSSSQRLAFPSCFDILPPWCYHVAHHYDERFAGNQEGTRCILTMLIPTRITNSYAALKSLTSLVSRIRRQLTTYVGQKESSGYYEGEPVRSSFIFPMLHVVGNGTTMKIPSFTISFFFLSACLEYPPHSPRRCEKLMFLGVQHCVCVI